MQFDERRYRPLSTVDLFDEAFDLYKKNFVLFLSIVAIVVVPTTVFTDIYTLKVLNAVVARISGGDLGTADATTALSTVGDFARVAVNQFVIFYCVMLVPWTLAFLALATAVSARYLDRPITASGAYIASFRKTLPGVGSAILFTLLLNAGTLIAALSIPLPDLAPLFIFVGVFVELFCSVIVIAKYPLFMGALVNENLGAFASLKRSSVLTHADSGRIVWTQVCLTVLTLSVAAAIEGVLELLAGGLVNSTILVVPLLANNRIVAGQIADGLADMLLTPFAMIVITLLYFDQRIRKEGYDMDVLAKGLGYSDIVVGAQAAYAPALTVAPTVKRGRK